MRFQYQQWVSVSGDFTEGDRRWVDLDDKSGVLVDSGLMDIAIKYEAPTTEEYRALRVVCGLSPKEEKAAEIGLRNSVYCVTIRTSGKLIAMGRLIGDSGCFVQVVDIAVHPDFQKQGLGGKIMGEIMTFIRKNIPASCFVSLFADVGFLYEKFGFVPSEKSKGMYLDRTRL